MLRDVLKTEMKVDLLEILKEISLTFPESTKEAEDFLLLEVCQIITITKESC